VLKALALGAAFVWIGRPFIYAATIDGHDGVRHAIKLMQGEIERDMMMLGIRALDELGAHAVKRASA
jgi:L-lactate dehydrogenase (cytochrome)